MPEMNDHDALVTLIAEVRQLQQDIRDLKDGTSVKVSDHETRLRRLELWGGMAIGALFILQIIGERIADRFIN